MNPEILEPQKVIVSVTMDILSTNPASRHLLSCPEARFVTVIGM